MRVGWLALLLVLGLCSAARADVVEPPPTDCIAGSRGFTCHGGVGCEPVHCMLDSDCAAGERCELRSLCVGSFDCFWSGPQPIVTGPCESEPCVAGSMCVNTRYCVRGSAPDSGPPPVDAATTPVDAATPIDAFVAVDSGSTGDAGDGRMLTLGGCGCGVAARGGHPGLLVVALVTLVAWRARRQGRNGRRVWPTRRSRGAEWGRS